MDSAKRILRAPSGFLYLCGALSLQVIPTLFWRRSGAAFRSLAGKKMGEQFDAVRFRSCKGTATASTAAAAPFTGTIAASSVSGACGSRTFAGEQVDGATSGGCSTYGGQGMSSDVRPIDAKGAWHSPSDED